jgi:hypothetical protein
MPQVLQIGTPCIVIKHPKMIKEGEGERKRQRASSFGCPTVTTHAIQ